MAAAASDLVASQQHYDRHRFDNYTGWLDREDRKAALKDGRALGFGYEVPKTPPPAREEAPFYAQEYSMTSGLLVNRRYDQYQSGYACGVTRSDPHHEPNHLEVKEHHHYINQQRRIQHVDPTMWKVDPKLRDAVSEDMVKQKVAQDRGEVRANIDPVAVETLFDENIRPQAHTLKELNVDLSCVTLPARETGRSTGGRSTPSGSKSNATARSAAGSEKWQWCMGGRKPLPLGQLSPAEIKMVKSTSMPTTLPGPSTLYGNMGGTATAFHGSPTRKFGASNQWDGRMRGGKLARDGWAGTFPAKEGRPP